MRLYSVILCASFALSAAPASATYIAETEPNDIQATAQNVNGAFSLDADPDIQEATSAPHASIRATGDGSFDFYAFTVPVGGARLIIDLDYGTIGGIDGHLRVFDPSSTEIGNDDNTTPAAGAGGSTADLPGPISLDPFIELLVANGGLYAVKVGQSAFGNPGDTGLPQGTSYTLHISLATVPEPAAAALLCLGLGLAAARLRRR